VPRNKPEVVLTRHDDRLASLLAEPETRDGIGDIVRYDHSKKMWHYWDGIRWKRDLTRHLYELVRLKLMIWLEKNQHAESKIKEMTPLLEVRKKETVLLSLSARDGIALIGDEWDRSPNLIGCKNGVLDLETGKLDTDPDPAMMISRQVNVAYNPKADCPRFIQFLHEITGGDTQLERYLLQVLGYSLFGWQREQKFWMWVGQGNNGKGTLAKVVAWVLGEYADTPSSELYMKTRAGASHSKDPRADLVKLQGIRWTWMSEPQGGQFNDEMLKAHTGDDPIQARALHSNMFVTFRPSHTIIFLTNEAPRTDDVGLSMRRRVRLIRFDQDFSAPGVIDLGLEDKLRAEGEGIFRLLVRFAGIWSRGGFDEPAKVTEWSNAYIEENDPVATFVAEWCVRVVDSRVAAGTLYREYTEWHGRFGDPSMKAMTQTSFGTAVSKRFNKMKSDGIVYYVGLKLRSAMEIAHDDD